MDVPTGADLTLSRHYCPLLIPVLSRYAGKCLEVVSTKDRSASSGSVRPVKSWSIRASWFKARLLVGNLQKRRDVVMLSVARAAQGVVDWSITRSTAEIKGSKTFAAALVPILCTWSHPVLHFVAYHSEQAPSCHSHVGSTQRFPATIRYPTYRQTRYPLDPKNHTLRQKICHSVVIW